MAAVLTPPNETTRVTVEEYIARFVDGGEKPTCEYVDGELFPKAMGTKPHAHVQGNLIFAVRSRYDDLLNA